MHLHTVEAKTPALFIGRLRETEKIQIRGATPGRLEHLRLNDFRVDNMSEADMIEVQNMLIADLRKHDAQPKWWVKQTWMI